MSDLFLIREIPTWHRLKWSVTWAGRGDVSKPENTKKIWESAFGALVESLTIGVAFERGDAVSIDASLAYRDDSVDQLQYFVQHYGGIVGVAFELQQEAERFADNLEKHIAWNLLKREYHE